MKNILGLICLIFPYVLCGQYLFNNDTSAQLYHGYTNSFKCEKGTPLCFDGTTKITPSDKENIYYIEVLDSVTRGCLLYTSPSPRDLSTSRMPSSA